MKALLVNPFIYDFAAFDLWAKPRGLLEVGRLCTRLGFSVEFIDCLDRGDPGMERFAARHGRIVRPRQKRFGTGTYFQEQVDKPKELRHFPRRYYRFGFQPSFLAECLQQLNPPPAFVGVAGIMTYWWHGARDTIQVIKTVWPHVPVILGGIYPTLLPDHARRWSGADMVFTGRVSLAALHSLMTQIGLPIPELPEAAARHSQPDDRPFYPYRHPTYGITALSDGCPRQCSYCASRLLNPEWRRRERSLAVGEVEQAASLGCQDVAFYDDDLLEDFEQNLLPFLEEAHSRGLRFRYHTPNGLYLRSITRQRARQLKQFGFETLRFGLETMDETLSRRIGPKSNPQEFPDRLEDLRQAGFRDDQMGFYLLMGLPGQTPDSVAASIRFVKACGVRPRLAEFSPVPGTADFALACRESLLDIVTEPLFQNNSLLSARSPLFDELTINRLKQRCHE